jgi:hypothetical protein
MITWLGCPSKLLNNFPFLIFQRHQRNVKIFWMLTWGWFKAKSCKTVVWIFWEFWVIKSILRYQGDWNLAALAKVHVKNKWMSFYWRPHLQQILEICLEYLDALSPMGMARLMILQANVLILGNNSLSPQTLFSSLSAVSSGGTGLGEPASKKACRQVL